MVKILIRIYNWFKLLSQTFFSLLKVLFMSGKGLQVDKQDKTNENLIILGNGPSLQDFLDKDSKYLASIDLMAVNHFAISDYFTELMPKYYVAIAHDLYLEDVQEHFVEASNKLFKSIAEKTTWHMILFMPREARKYQRWQKDISKNKNIEIKYFNLTPVEGFRSTRHWFYSKNHGMPRPHNVMVPSIYLSILLNRKKIGLLGADHSWLQNIIVNKDNEAMFVNKHFYDQKLTYKRFDYMGRTFLSLHEILNTFSQAFKSYHILNTWAKSKDIKVLNLTPDSFIDAYERQELEEFKRNN